MRRTYRLFIYCLMAVGASCNSSTTKQGSKNSAVVHTFKPTWAEGFEIQALADSTLRLILFNLESKSDTLAIIPFDNKKTDRIACLSTTHIAMLQQLGRLDDVKGVGFADLVQNSDAAQKIREGKIINLTSSHDVEPEIVFGIDAQLFFVYPFGGTDYSRYEQQNILCIPVSEYLEKHPLGRAEWIRVFGALLGETHKADSIFNSISEAYMQRSRQATNAATSRPSVFTGFYDSGSWFAPPGNSFAAQFIEDAGADYIFSDSISGSNIIVSFEVMLERTDTVDYWGKIISEKGPLTMAHVAEEEPRLRNIKSFRDKNIFYCNAAETDYHGDAVMQPHVILADLIAIFHPEIMMSHQPVYFHKVAQ